MTDTPALDFQVGDWLQRRSSRTADWPVERLLQLKGGTTISVVIPARNEEATVGEIVRTIRTHLVEAAALVDEVLVVDSRSEDDTARVAAAAGATVVAEQHVLAQLPPMRGKGEALWKGLAASTGDIVVFVDGDLREFTADYVTGLVGPLLADRSIAYVKGFYHRPLVGDDGVQPDGGGRVTELVARPLLNMHWPALAGFVQPLAGEYAGRRAVLEQIPFMAHYGVEIGHLVDLLELVGLDALAQVDLGHRKHRHQSIHALGVMASQIMLTVNDRLERYGRMIPADDPSTTLAQFRRGDGDSGVDRELVLSRLTMDFRPPLRSLRSRTRTH
jgi:glucosyl-3-phosphoglycerate synthase